MTNDPPGGRRAVVLAKRAFVVIYVSITIAVTLASLNESTLLSPIGVLALVLAPFAIVSVLVGGFAIGIPWVLGLTDADPDGYGDAWAYALGTMTAAVNAGLYLWLATRYRRRPHQGSA